MAQTALTTVIIMIFNVTLMIMLTNIMIRMNCFWTCDCNLVFLCDTRIVETFMSFFVFVIMFLSKAISHILLILDIVRIDFLS